MMNKVSKEKRNKVILVWVMTLAVVGGWAFLFLSWQLDSKHQASKDLVSRQTQLTSMKNLVKQNDAIKQSLAEAEQSLNSLESRMVNSDAYSWTLDTLGKFKQGYEVDLPQFGKPNETDNTLLPKFPYKQVAMTVAGTAYFQDLGMFIADFENRFRFARILNLSIQPNGNIGADPREKEKLDFKMDVVFLVKPKQP
jgi:hypothetical protein